MNARTSQRKPAVALVAALSLTAALGAGIVATTQASGAGDQGAETNAVAAETRTEAGTDRTVHLASAIDLSSFTKTEVERTDLATSCFVEEPTIRNLSKYATVVVSGRIVALTYTTSNGVAWTKADVLVDHVLKGEASPGDTVSVFLEHQGYIPLQEYAGEHARDWGSTTTRSKRDLENTVIEETNESGRLDRVGDQAVFFLSPQDETKKWEGGFELYFSGFSELRSADDGKAYESLWDEGQEKLTLEAVEEKAHLDGPDES